MTRKLVYRIEKEVTFAAAHHIDGLPEGHKCGGNHGHTYRMRVLLSATELDDVGFILDYGVVSSIRDRLDHKDLNVVMGKMNPTSENLCRFVYESMNAIILRMDAVEDVKVERVQIWESAESMAEIVVVDT
jgi:6-pyruvoyltetrahydropterin/6-carboxytetrahydropterin synthase